MRSRVLFSLLAVFLLVAFTAMAAEGKPEEKGGQNTHTYSGNDKTMKYHNSGCRYFTCKDCTVRFSSADEAKSKGYSACKSCGG